MILLGFAVLVILRPIGEIFFYDPLETYYQNDYLKMPLPEMNLPLLGLSVSLKYFLNSIVSVGIIHVAFLNKNNTIFAIKIYALAYLILISVFFLIIVWEPINSARFLFYIRRFLIHPVFVLLLIPAFYYQELKHKKESGNFYF